MFEYSTTADTGATIFLRDDAERQTAPDSSFKEYAASRWRSWSVFVSRPGSAYTAYAKSLVLIYGHTKTSSWASLAFETHAQEGEVKFQLDLPQLGAIDIGAHHESSSTISPRHNHGPWPDRTSSLSVRGRDEPSRSDNNLPRRARGRGNGRGRRQNRTAPGGRSCPNQTHSERLSHEPEDSSPSVSLHRDQAIFIDYITAAERTWRDKLHLRVSLPWPIQKRGTVAGSNYLSGNTLSSGSSSPTNAGLGRSSASTSRLSLKDSPSQGISPANDNGTDIDSVDAMGEV